ncbi:MAG: 30S ribosomal protein S9 [Dehalococcoidia bacterium]|nr:30S ribosomal protein S9 [Dehalococcoidia bacterium]
MAERKHFYGTGKRKTAIARVKLLPGGGSVVVNDRPLQEAFPDEPLREVIFQALRVTNTQDKYGVAAKVTGGGISGQAAALRHGIARALVEADEGLKPVLRQHGLLTRDARIKERKKYGLKRARKAPQYTKR